MELSSRGLLGVRAKLLPICEFEILGSGREPIPPQRMIPPRKGDIISLYVKETNSNTRWEVEKVTWYFSDAVFNKETESDHTELTSVVVKLSWLREG